LLFQIKTALHPLSVGDAPDITVFTRFLAFLLPLNQLAVDAWRRLARVDTTDPDRPVLFLGRETVRMF
jgi:hypothetical protein